MVKIIGGYHEIKAYEPAVKLPEVKCNPGGEPYIQCSGCSKVMMVLHKCYDKNLEPTRHILKGEDVCHWCWDENLKGAVEAGLY